jgi:hypothetical protein
MQPSLLAGRFRSAAWAPWHWWPLAIAPFPSSVSFWRGIDEPTPLRGSRHRPASAESGSFSGRPRGDSITSSIRWLSGWVRADCFARRMIAVVGHPEPAPLGLAQHPGAPGRTSALVARASRELFTLHPGCQVQIGWCDYWRSYERLHHHLYLHIGWCRIAIFGLAPKPGRPHRRLSAGRVYGAQRLPVSMSVPKHVWRGASGTIVMSWRLSSLVSRDVL